ncbi:hypothetical protein [Parabacteroides sp. PF5-9]|uniref:hypothetical protein n=1 Tax=Parabacteroides sp. PF5-9 TaxID=1742404 RepID=UPI0024760FFC|nr:hypothetical protein [Parabacteroides sp. PF5-9]MDH6359087.1 methionyl-tRNA synthetase [Parabacteroides sp. PF5-9]
MENLLKRLQEEAGLTEEQATDAVRVVVDFMDKEGLDIDWDKFLSGKYEKFKEQSQSFFDDLAQKSKKYTNTISDKAEDLITEAKRKVRDISDHLD